MKLRQTVATLALLGILASGLSACTTPMTASQQNNTTNGALAGAAVGAVVGNIIGKNHQNTIGGAAIGAVLGGVVGNGWDDKKAQIMGQ